MQWQRRQSTHQQGTLGLVKGRGKTPLRGKPLEILLLLDCHKMFSREYNESKSINNNQSQSFDLFKKSTNQYPKYVPIAKIMQSKIHVHFLFTLRSSCSTFVVHVHPSEFFFNLHNSFFTLFSSYSTFEVLVHPSQFMFKLPKSCSPFALSIQPS